MQLSDERIPRIDELISMADKIAKIKTNIPGRDIYVSPPYFTRWITDVSQFFADNFDDDNCYRLSFDMVIVQQCDPDRPLRQHLFQGREILMGARKYLIDNPTYSKIPTKDSIHQLEIIFDSFHTVANKLRDRKRNAPPLLIENEYDVHYLLHALLKLFFNDIRPEETTPSIGGGSSRMDFLLKKEKIVIEVKKTRPSMSDSELSNQLFIDFAHYGESPDCDRLMCFIYDPDELIENKAGLKDDLMAKSTKELPIHVYIRPMDR